MIDATHVDEMLLACWRMLTALKEHRQIVQSGKNSHGLSGCFRAEAQILNAKATEYIAAIEADNPGLNFYPLPRGFPMRPLSNAAAYADTIVAVDFDGLYSGRSIQGGQ